MESFGTVMGEAITLNDNNNDSILSDEVKLGIAPIRPLSSPSNIIENESNKTGSENSPKKIKNESESENEKGKEKEKLKEVDMEIENFPKISKITSPIPPPPIIRKSFVDMKGNDDQTKHTPKENNFSTYKRKRTVFGVKELPRPTSPEVGKFDSVKIVKNQEPVVENSIKVGKSSLEKDLDEIREEVLMELLNPEEKIL